MSGRRGVARASYVLEALGQLQPIAHVRPLIARAVLPTMAPCLDEELARMVRDAVAEVVVFVRTGCQYMRMLCHDQDTHSLAQVQVK